MSTGIKRRTTTKNRPLRKTYSKLISVGKGGWLDEIFAIASAAFSIFLLIALASYQYNSSLQYDFLYDEIIAPKNIMGPVGELLASVLYNSMGWCAYVPVVWSAWLAWYYWKFDQHQSGEKSFFRFSFFIGLLLMLLFSSSIGALLGGAAAGGSVGFSLSKPLVDLFNFWGALLFSVLGFFLSMAMITKRTLPQVLSLTLRSTLSAALVIFIKLPFRVLGFISLIAHIVLYLFSSFWNFILAISGAANEASEIEELSSLPKPRRRGAEIKQAEENLSEEGQDHDEKYSHVVVSRKTPDARLKLNQGKLLKKRIEKIKSKDKSNFEDYVRPELSFLTKSEENFVSENDDELIKTSKQIESKLRDFNILGRVTEVHPGPVITLYEFEPAAGVKVGRISALQDDLAMSLRATSIRIIAPIPKRGTVGIEIPNRHRELVRLRDVLESEAFVNADSTLNVAIGKDTYGEPVVVDIASMPHLLMAGTTGTGKSVCINTILLSLLYRCTPAELGLILIDPKILELSVYEGVPHLKVPVVTNAKQAKAVLDWAAREMERRYRLMQRYGVRSIDGYNKIVKGDKETGEKIKPDTSASLIELQEDEIIQSGTIDKLDDKPPMQAELDMFMAEELESLPKIVIVIDELADLMLAVGREIEELVTRLAQKARAAGIHLIIATQRPSVDVITGLIKANFPARLSFRVSSRIDSRTILDSMGAEKLLGRGDMLFQAPGSVHLKRVHGAFVSDNEVKKVIEFLKKSTKPNYDEKIIRVCEQALEEEQAASSGSAFEEDSDYDSFYDKAVELVVQKGQASTSMIQRAFRIGYNRAARIIETMEKEGIIGPMDGVKPRDVLIQPQEGVE